MFGDIFNSVLDLADEVITPVTEVVEDVTGIDSDLQKGILTTVAVSYVTGGILDALLDD